MVRNKPMALQQEAPSECSSEMESLLREDTEIPTQEGVRERDGVGTRWYARPCVLQKLGPEESAQEKGSHGIPEN